MISNHVVSQFMTLMPVCTGRPSDYLKSGGAATGCYTVVHWMFQSGLLALLRVEYLLNDLHLNL